MYFPEKGNRLIFKGRLFPSRLACLCYYFQLITRRIATEIVNVVVEYLFKQRTKTPRWDQKRLKISKDEYLCIYDNILVDIKDCKTNLMLSFGYKRKMLYKPVPEVFVCPAVNVWSETETVVNCIINYDAANENQHRHSNRTGYPIALLKFSFILWFITR